MDDNRANEVNERINDPIINNDSYKEYGMAIIKMVMATIPPIGPALNEIIDARFSIKRKRVENFVLEFAKYLKNKSNHHIDLEALSQEIIGDILEEIIISVSKTSSEQKRVLFRNIQYSSFEEKEIEIDSVLKYINITNRISILQFNILGKFDVYSDNYLEKRRDVNKKSGDLKLIKNSLDKEKKDSEKGYANNLKTVDEQYKKVKNELAILKDEFSKLVNPNRSEIYSLDNYEFAAEVQDLIATGLLYHFNSRQQTLSPIYHITKQGKKYIEYLKNE